MSQYRFKSVFIAASILTILGSANAVAEIVTIDVVIKSVDAESRSITVTKNSGAKSKDLQLEVGKKAKVSVDGNPATLKDIEIGVKASVAYESDLEVVTKIEIVTNGKLPMTDDPESIENRKPGCKVIWKIEKDGNSSITISRPSKRNDSEKDSVVKHDDGTVEFNHGFLSKESIDKAFMEKPDTFSFDRSRNGLAIKPAIGKLGSYSKFFRYPVSIEFMIEASQSDKNSTLAISGINNRIGVGVLLNISSQDSFKSNAIVSGTEVKFLNGKSVTKPIFEKQTIDLSESKEIPFEAPHMNDDEVISFTLGLRGETPFIIRALNFRGQVIPSFGIKLGEKNSLVTADTVTKTGLGDSIGIRQGDVIISINGSKPITVKDSISYLSKVQYGMESEIVVKRGGKVVKIGFTPDLD
jgi:hypothetical protein